MTRGQAQIDAEAALDGFYVLRTCVPAGELDAPGVVTAYKNLKYVERDFRHIKADDLDLRPVYHHLEERVKAHVLIWMLACYLTWHLRRAWAPLTFTDENPPSGGDPVAPPAAPPPPRPKPPASTTRPPALPQPPRPAGPPRHPDPQPGPLRRRNRHRAHARRADQRAARSIPAHRRPHPADLDVSRTTPRPARKLQASTRIAYPTSRNFGLGRRGVIIDVGTRTVGE